MEKNILRVYILKYDGTTGLMDMSLSNQELVMDKEAWHAAVRGVAELDSIEWLNWTEFSSLHPQLEAFLKHTEES